MTFREGISERLKNDFEERANEGTKMLIDAITKVDYLKTDRVIRCIIFFVKGSLADLNKYIEKVTFDTRDVMLWAEYEKSTGCFKYKRLRDFNKTFDKCSNEVKE